MVVRMPGCTYIIFARITRPIAGALLIFWLPCTYARAAPSSPLTTTYAAKHFTSTGGDVRHPVLLRGVVTYNRTGPDGDVYCIQDATGGIFIEAPGRRLPGKPGDIVEVQGFVTYSAIVEPVIRIVGSARLPRPIRLNFAALNNGTSDGQ